jgi:hypothetical protein
VRALALISENDRRALLDAAKGEGGAVVAEAGAGGAGGGGQSGKSAGGEKSAGPGGMVARERYVPADEEWTAKEDALLRVMEADDEAKRAGLAVETPGSDELLVKGGFRVQVR